MMKRVAMRRPLSHVLVLACAASLVTVSCRTAGVRYVIMAIDSQGKQPRNTFYTDSSNVYCVAIASAANPDTTIDFVIRQDTSTDPWLDNGSTMPVGLPSTEIFAAGEVTVMPGSEEAESLEILPEGVMTSAQCYGYCRQNGVGTCQSAYTDEGPDSCGTGAECCYLFGAPAATISQTAFPYPVGHFECDATLNGEAAGTAQFDIVYPPTGCPTVPASSGQPCYGWVPPGSVCPGAGDYCCTCQGPQQVQPGSPTFGLWECSELPITANTCPP
jgi:hypothetical protein